MLNCRLKQLRLARGLSLEALAAEMGGIVTKQALSKYERGKTQPSREVLNKLAAALQTKSSYLWSQPTISVELTAYRKNVRLPKKEQERIENWVRQNLEERVQLQALIHQDNNIDLPIRAFKVRKLEDAEGAAEQMRARWNLGAASIASVVDILEEHHIHVLEIDTSNRFDGIAAIAYDEEQREKAAAVVVRQGLPGERQRLDFLHELGHLVLDVSKNCDEEKVAFRFGAAFLAPAAVLIREVGTRRAFVQAEELLLLKKRFGLSVQALLYRLKDLQIITDSYYKQWCIDINRLGWRKQEPLECPPEQPTWLRQNVLRALSEGVITQDQAQTLLDEEIEMEQPLPLIQRRKFMQLPLEERRRLMTQQAEKLSEHYEQDQEWKKIEGDDFVEY